MLGYCVFPLAVASVLIKLLSLFGLKKGLVAFIVDFVIVTLAFVWAMFGKSKNPFFWKLVSIVFQPLVNSEFVLNLQLFQNDS